MKKRDLTEFGKEIKLELMFQNQTQEWLLQQLRAARPDMYVDSSVLYKIMTGQIEKSSLEVPIRSILNI